MYWYTTPIKYLGGTEQINNPETYWANSFGKALLIDDTSLVVDTMPGSCISNWGTAGTGLANSGCGQTTIDINGAANPNTRVRDITHFYITQFSIYPMGSLGDSTSCDINSATPNISYGCSSKVLSERTINS